MKNIINHGSIKNLMISMNAKYVKKQMVLLFY